MKKYPIVASPWELCFAMKIKNAIIIVLIIIVIMIIILIIITLACKRSINVGGNIRIDRPQREIDGKIQTKRKSERERQREIEKEKGKGR